MSFSHATAMDGLPFLLAGLYLCWMAFRPVPEDIAEDARKLRRYNSRKELFAFAGPGLTIASALFILAKLSFQ